MYNMILYERACVRACVRVCTCVHCFRAKAFLRKKVPEEGKCWK